VNRRYGKWVFYEGRWIPIFAGGSTDGDGSGNSSNSDNGNSNNNSNNTPGKTDEGNPVNPDEIVAKKLKELGFNSLEEVKKVKKEYEKLSKQAKEQNKSLEEKLAQLENLYKTEKVRSEIIKLATKYNAIEPEDIFILAKENAKLTEDGKILISDKPPEEFIKELKEKRPHWFKADDKEGSGTSNVKEPKKELSPQEKLAKIFQLKK